MAVVELATVLLVATAVCDALGFAVASFYVLLAGVPLLATAALAAFAGLVDAANGDGMERRGRLQAALSALLVAVVVLGAALRSPAVSDANGAGPETLVLAAGFLFVALHALVALAPVRR